MKKELITHDKFWGEFTFKKLPFFERKFWNIHYGIKDLIFKTKQLFQKIIRPNHLSDVEVWNAGYTMVNKIYPILKTFKKSNF